MQFTTTSSVLLAGTSVRLLQVAGTPTAVRPTPTASSNQQLLEYILAALVAVAVAIIILLGVRFVSISHQDVTYHTLYDMYICQFLYFYSLCFAIYKLTRSNKVQGSKDKQKNLYNVKQQEIEIVYDELDVAHSSKHNSIVVAENGKDEVNKQRKSVMEENTAYGTVITNEASEEDSNKKEKDPIYTWNFYIASMQHGDNQPLYSIVIIV